MIKDYKNLVVCAVTSAGVAVASHAWPLQVHAQIEKQERPAECLALSENESHTAPLPDYLAEKEPWPEKLELSTEQMSQIVSLKSDYSINTAKQKAELQADMKKMVLLMTEPKANEDSVRSLNVKINSIITQLADARVKMMLEAMKIMTPSQKEQMRHNMLVHELSHQNSLLRRHIHHHST